MAMALQATSRQPLHACMTLCLLTRPLGLLLLREHAYHVSVCVCFEHQALKRVCGLMQCHEGVEGGGYTEGCLLSWNLCN